MAERETDRIVKGSKDADFSNEDTTASSAHETALDRFITEALRPRVDPLYWEKVWPRVQVAVIARQERRRHGWLRWVLSGASALVTAVGLFLFLTLRTVSVPQLSFHDPSYFADLAQSPPAIVETDTEQQTSLELANLTLGMPTPTDRTEVWKHLEEL